jgi:aspartate ammonia-lyase
LLIGANKTLEENLITGISFHGKVSETKLWHSPAVTTALGPYIGYHQAAALAKQMKEANVDIFEANAVLKLIDDGNLRLILKPENLLKLGYSIKDLQT